MIHCNWILVVLAIEVGPHLVTLGIICLHYLKYHLGINCYQVVRCLCPEYGITGIHLAVFLEVVHTDSLSRFAIA